MLEHYYETLPAGWWGPRKWKRLTARIEPWILPAFEDLRRLLLECHAQIGALTEQLVDSMGGQRLPKGLGALTMAVLDGEVRIIRSPESCSKPGHWLPVMDPMREKLRTLTREFHCSHWSAPYLYVQDS